MSTKKYVYVDYENMSNLKALTPVDGKYYFFIGETQAKLPVKLVMATNNINVEWIRIQGAGKNALDFHIAYYLGVNAIVSDSMHYVLSKDKGYDPLIASINKKNGKETVKRIINLDELTPKTKAEKPADINQEYAALENKLKGMAKSTRPKSEKRLEAFIRTSVFPNIADNKIRKLIDELYRNKFISKGLNNRISYS